MRQHQKFENVELPNQCLGIDSGGKYCTKMLPKGQHLCSNCQKRVNLIDKSHYLVLHIYEKHRLNTSDDE